MHWKFVLHTLTNALLSSRHHLDRKSLPSLPQSTDHLSHASAFPEIDAWWRLFAGWKLSRWLFGTVQGAVCWVAVVAFVLAALVGAMRGLPRPMIHDEFSYLLAGELYSQFRWSAPAPANPEFFETFHELTTPRRASKYPIAQGMCLALGFWLGTPIVGVWLATAVLGGALVWALRGYLPLRWSVVGALAGEGLFGATTYWAQSFWGGAMAAIGGALVWGALRRLCLRPTAAVSVVMGVGVTILLHSRPFEGALFCVVPALLLFRRTIRAWRHSDSWPWRSALLPAAVIVTGGFGLLAWVNKSVTGSFTRLPYIVYDQRYHSTRSFLWETSRPSPMDIPDRMMRMDEEQIVPFAHWPKPVVLEWLRRARNDGFQYFGPVLLIAAAFVALVGPNAWTRRAFAAMIMCWLSFVLSVWFLPHYQAPAAVAALQISMEGLRRLRRALPTRRARKILAGVAICHLAIVVARPDIGSPNPEVVRSFDRFDRVVANLERDPGRDLVFVSYDSKATIHAEFVFNAADFDGSSIVWARDLGDRDAELAGHFPERKLWRLHVGAEEMALQPITSVTQGK